MALREVVLTVVVKTKSYYCVSMVKSLINLSGIKKKIHHLPLKCLFVL